MLINSIDVNWKEGKSAWRGDNKSQNTDRIKDIALIPLWKNGSLFRLILINERNNLSTCIPYQLPSIDHIILSQNY